MIKEKTIKKKIGEIEEIKIKGEKLPKICSSRWYVHEDTPISELIDFDFNSLLAPEDRMNSVINAVAVVDDNLQAKGILILQEINAQLSRQFGREILGQNPVKEFIQQVPFFRQEQGIIDAADDLGDRINNLKTGYYLVTGSEKKYFGIFSSKDMLIYLSGLTKRDMETAKKIQKRLVKDFQYVKDPDFEACCSSIMASDLGGDFYHIKKISEDVLFATVCDVSGKGASASLISSMIIGLISIFDFSEGLVQLASTINRVFTNMFLQEKFITGVFFLYHRKTGNIEYCDMGHSHIYLQSKGKLTLLPDKARMPIGIDPDLEIGSTELILKPGETLVILTDGILEQTNSEGKIYPLKRLSAFLNKNSESGLKGIIIRILEDFHRFKGIRSAHDDSTLFMLKNKRSC